MVAELKLDGLMCLVGDRLVGWVASVLSSSPGGSFIEQAQIIHMMVSRFPSPKLKCLSN
jgi:hypothetical protein